MPNFDGGHYFLTVLAPIRSDPRKDDQGQPRAPAHLIREALAFLSPAEQTVASASRGRDSPFSRVPGTHFARFFVLDDAVYNGRQDMDSLLYTVEGAIGRAPPLTTSQPVDRLAAKYLVFFAAFDAASADRSELDRYLAAMWREMRGDLLKIFGNCVGFDRIDSAEGFGAYMKRCQVETTMPFNDYWIASPPLKTFDLKPWMAPLAVLALVTLGGLIALLVGPHRPMALLIFVLSAGVTALVAWMAYRALMQAGEAPFPTAPNSDLRSVLKALELQRQFTTFAIRSQAADDAALYRQFGEFLAACQPDDLDTATQSPGIIPGIRAP
jgi:hypothetical protein